MKAVKMTVPMCGDHWGYERYKALALETMAEKGARLERIIEGDPYLDQENNELVRDVIVTWDDDDRIQSAI